MGLKEVLKEGRNPYDGREVLRRLKDKSKIRFYGQINSCAFGLGSVPSSPDPQSVVAALQINCGMCDTKA